MSDFRGLSMIAMPRTGHRAVMLWLAGKTETVRRDRPIGNIEGKSFDESMAICEQTGTAPVMLLRDYPNWLASMVTFFETCRNDSRRMNKFVDCWMTHMENAFSVPTILFPNWVAAGHGDGITVNPDSPVTKFVGGSVLDRGSQMGDHPMYLEMMSTRQDAISISEKVFNPA